MMLNCKNIFATLVLSATLPLVVSAQEKVDIWNLPELPVEQGEYTTAWDNLSRRYNVPAWWREAKLGAWSHWDPQSMAEDGDWYALRMYAPLVGTVRRAREKATSTTTSPSAIRQATDGLSPSQANGSASLPLQANMRVGCKL